MFETDASLLDQIRLGEDSRLALKSVRFRGTRLLAPGREDLADEIGAFANGSGGVVVLGVDDKSRDIEGIPLDRLDAVERLVQEACQDSLKPAVVPRILRRLLPDGTGNRRAVLQVDVPKSLFVHASPGGYFHRIGSSKRQMAPDFLARLFQQRSQTRLIRFDEQAVPDSSPDSLDEALWRRFLGEATDEDAWVSLNKLRLIAQDDTETWRATVGGVLMATRQPERWLPNAVIEAVHYSGVDRDANYQRDARLITGPLDRQIAEAVAFVERSMPVSAKKAPGRIDRPAYSLRAVFEAVVNAVAHRDYAIHGSKIRLFLFADRLELSSPGALPNTLSIESLPLRQSTRNELITSLLAKCPVEAGAQSAWGRQRLMDKRGEGVPIILKESRSLSGRAPVYRLIDESELLLTIYAAEPDS